MTLTATLSAVNTALRGTMPPLAGLPAGMTIGVTVGDFAGSFAKASEEAVPGPIPGAPSSQAVDVPLDAPLPIPAPLPAQTADPLATRQEWAATGKGLPIAVVAGATAVAWPSALMPRSPDAQSDPTSAVPAKAVLVAGRAPPADARPATVTRPAPGARPGPATGSDRAVEPGEADDTNEPTTAGEAPSVPPSVVGVPREIDGVPTVPVAMPVTAAVLVADAPRSDVAVPDPDVAPPKVLTRPRAGRRNRPAMPVSPAEPAPTRTAPAASQTAPPLAAVTLVPSAAPTAAATAASAGVLQNTPVEPAPAVPSMAHTLRRPAAERGTVLLDGAASVPANRFAPRPPLAPQAPVETVPSSPAASAVRQGLADTAVPDGAPARVTAPTDTEAMPPIPAADAAAPVIIAPAVSGGGIARPKVSGAGDLSPARAITTQQDRVQPAPVLVSAPLVAGSPSNDLKSLSLPIAAAIPPTATALAPQRVRTDGPTTVPSVGLAVAPPGLASSATMTSATDVPSIRPTMLATAARDALGFAVNPPVAQILLRATGVGTPREIVQGDTAKVVAPRSSGTQVTAAVGLASPLAPVQPTTVAAMPALVSPNVSTAMVPPSDAQVPQLAIVQNAESVTTPAAPVISGTPRWTATEATTPVALAMAQPDMIQPQPGTVASAAQVFGAAIQAATRTHDAETTVDSTGLPDAASLSATVAPAPPIATAAAQQAPLDMRQERWPHAMIERIETIRDAADAIDTRIRLIPDALGAIDVSVKTDGDTVHVHFNAEQAATRTLLADAQPRLAELAEARGLKLGQGAVGDGSAGGNTGGSAGASQQRAPTTPHLPNRTASASVPTADATDDTRIA